MDSIDISSNSADRDGVFKWWSTDSQENYLNNILVHPQVMEHWKAFDITYSINPYGFRSPNFELDTDCIVSLGCSHTFGVGLPVEKTFTQIVADHFGLINYNLGVEGGSPDTCYRLGSHWIPKLKPKFVVYRPPSKHRFEIKMQGNGEVFWHRFLPSGKDNVVVAQSNFGSYYEQYLDNDSNSDLNYQKNLDALANVCSDSGATLVVLEDDDWTPTDGIMSRARDLQHGGVEQNKYWATKVINAVGPDTRSLSFALANCNVIFT